MAALLLNLVMAALSVDLLHAALRGEQSLLPPVAWVAVLLLAALTAAVSHGRPATAGSGAHRAMVAHRSLGAIVMAAALIVPATHVANLRAHDHAGGALDWLPIVGTAVLAVVAVSAVRPLRGRPRTVAVVECTVMTAACAVMSGWHVLA